jgi:hypothetical protein
MTCLIKSPKPGLPKNVTLALDFGFAATQSPVGNVNRACITQGSQRRIKPRDCESNSIRFRIFAASGRKTEAELYTTALSDAHSSSRLENSPSSASCFAARENSNSDAELFMMDAYQLSVCQKAKDLEAIARARNSYSKKHCTQSFDESPIRAAPKFAVFLELWPSHAVVRICDAVSYCARAAGRAGVVLSPSRAQTRAFSRDFAATAVWNRVGIAPLAIPSTDAERSGVVCRGDVSGLFVREI